MDFGVDDGGADRLLAGAALGLAIGLFLLVQARRSGGRMSRVPIRSETRETWRMPALSRLSKPALSTQRKLGLITLRGYLLVTFTLVVVKVVQVAIK